MGVNRLSLASITCPIGSRHDWQTVLVQVILQVIVEVCLWEWVESSRLAFFVPFVRNIVFLQCFCKFILQVIAQTYRWEWTGSTWTLFFVPSSVDMIDRQCFCKSSCRSLSECVVRIHTLSAMLLRVYLAGHCSDTVMGVNRFDMTGILCPIISRHAWLDPFGVHMSPRVVGPSWCPCAT